MQATDAGHIGLDLLQVSLVDELDTRDAVRLRPPMKLVESIELRLCRRNDELAAALVRDALLVAVPVQLGAALDAEASLQRARRVVDPGVDDPAVATGLVRGDPRLLLQDAHAGAGLTEQALARHRQAEDAASHNHPIGGVRAAQRSNFTTDSLRIPMDPSS
jgi:hypothetical protein